MLEADLQLLRDGAAEASKIAMRFFGHGPEVWDKGGGAGPVTEADLAIDKMLTSEFRGARPDYGWLSEETEDDADRMNRDWVFIVDPIDGTRSFINRHENFATSVAIAHKGEVMAAVVQLPARGLIYEASKDGGARLNGEVITQNGQHALEGARILASGSQTKSSLWKDGPPPIERHFRSSLAYRMCLVAQGRFDGMLSLRPTWEWDVAGGDLICREAGVVLSNCDGERPVYNQPTACMKGMIAGTPAVHKGLMEYL